MELINGGHEGYVGIIPHLVSEVKFVILKDGGLMKITEAQVKQLVKKYSQMMDLGDWKLKVIFTGKNKDFYAETAASPDYLNADIRFNLHKITSSELLHQTIFHELFHIWLSPFSQPAKYLVDKKAQVLLHSLEETLATRFERWAARELKEDE